MGVVYREKKKQIIFIIIIIYLFSDDSYLKIVDIYNI